MESIADPKVKGAPLPVEMAKPPSRPAIFLYAFAAATFFGAINAVQIISVDNGQHSWGEAFAHALLLWYLFLPIVPLAIALAQWLPAALGHRLRNLCIHSLVALAVGAIHPYAYVMAYSLATQPRWAIIVARSSLPYLHYWYMQDLLMAVLAYAMTVAATYAFLYYRSFQQGQLRAAHLQAQLANANLTALKMQLHPHFLFNALHSISALQMTDREAAQKMTALLGDFLRMTLRDLDRQEVPLRQEFEFLQRYLAIEQMRFGSRLRFSVDAAAEILDAAVPQLILQPIVENAVRHGITPYGCGGEIAVRAVRDNERLLLTVQDSGPGILEDRIDAPATSGLGLANTRARLSQLYGVAQHLVLENLSGGGFRVRVELPFRILEGEEGRNS
ncbi:MAG: histidine kinase [Terracidiphilus sp.]|jgi:sensor histidine kinase YesM